MAFEKVTPVEEKEVSVNLTKEDKAEQKRLAKAQKKAEKLAKKENKKGKSSVLGFVIPFLITVVLVSILFIFTKQATVDDVKTTVSVMYATNDIPKNTYISAEDYPNYFTVKATEDAHVSSVNITEVAQLPEEGLYITNSIVANQMILKDDFSSNNSNLTKYNEQTVRTAIATDNLNNSLNGRIRSGNIIDIYAIDPVTNALALMAKDVYVEKAYTSSGDEVVNDTDVSASFTILVNPSEIDSINTALVNGGIQLYLVE